MKSTQELIQLSNLQLSNLQFDLKSIRCVNWNCPIGVAVYIYDKDDDDEGNGGYNCIGLNKKDQNYEKDCKILKAAVSNTRLIHLTSMSIAINFVSHLCDSPIGLTIYIGNRIKIGEWAGHYNNTTLCKGSPGFDSDRKILRKLGARDEV